MTNKWFVKESIKTLKSMYRMYDALCDDPSVYSRSDDVLESLRSSIFQLACAVCPSDCLSDDDMREYVFSH